jgi:hypothetical protein
MSSVSKPVQQQLTLTGFACSVKTFHNYQSSAMRFAIFEQHIDQKLAMIFPQMIGWI